MLDQENEAPEVLDETPATVFYADEDAEWAEVLKVAPAMGRLPDMVAALYENDFGNDPKDHAQFQHEVKIRVRRGAIFVYKLIENNINKLFEQYDVRFGAAIDLLMDDLEATFIRDEEAVESYTMEEACGRLFAYIAMEVHCKHRADNEPYDGSAIDMETGLLKNMDHAAVIPMLEPVMDCVKMTPQLRIDARREAIAAIHATIFLLLDADDKTVWH